MIRDRAGNVNNEILMASSCSTNLPWTSFSATCSHEAEMNGENFAKLGFCHSHDHYAFVYIRRFNPLIHSQFLLTLVSTCFDYDMTASPHHTDAFSKFTDIFRMCHSNVITHSKTSRHFTKRESPAPHRRRGKYKPPFQLEYASDHN